MFTDSLSMGKNFSVQIQTTDNRGQTPEEVAERCVNKIIGVSDNAHPAIREQAHAYRREMEKIIAIYMRQAIKSDRTTVYNAIKDSGNPKLAEYIRRM
jgi:DNA-binding phage protein|tara:strand:- start:190 stop:483 length:294 start_codon:yes stop_codon:yes gene_type:complete